MNKEEYYKRIKKINNRFKTEFENDGFIKFMNNLLDILKEVSK